VRASAIVQIAVEPPGSGGRPIASELKRAAVPGETPDQQRYFGDVGIDVYRIGIVLPWRS
jgi:hypothetical protein